VELFITAYVMTSILREEAIMVFVMDAMLFWA